MKYTECPSPLGCLLLAADETGLRHIGFPTGKGRIEAASTWRRDDDAFSSVRKQLDEYFTGRRQQFELPLAPIGTPFQREVLNALLDIPYGETRSYADVARAIGRPRAVRAVGAANGRNPLPLVIPCHRVIGADGSLTGFGGGLEAKRFLLRLERSPGI
ncbi:methylated-DNA--[protein]-cysteine S-methyltransferase [Elongatibacter sediminis]|uniref:Methylated-DNA--protein-cysteine methyltransferase n=1 Tax=Elongatibacter sediminis TaxID=3119006 RepID=A0AAW9R985_9GAMM